MAKNELGFDDIDLATIPQRDISMTTSEKERAARSNRFPTEATPEQASRNQQFNADVAQVGPVDEFDTNPQQTPTQGFDVEGIPMFTPQNSGIGAATGGIAGALMEVANPVRRARAMQIASSGGKINKIKEALMSETRISAFGSAGDLAESAVKAGAKGNLPVAKQALKSAGEEFMFGMGFGLAGRGVIGTGNKIFFRPAATQSPAVNLAYDVLEDEMAKSKLPPITLAAATDNSLFDTLDNIARGGVGSAGIMTNADQAGFEAGQALLEVATKNITPQQPIRELTQQLFEAITHREAISDLPAIVHRNSVARQAAEEGVTVNIDELQNFVLKNADEITAIGGFGKGLSGVTFAQSLLNILEDPSVASVLQIRTFGKAMVRSLQSDIVKASTPRVGMAKKIAELSDKAVKQALGDADKTLNTTMKKQLEQSDADFFKHYDTFYNDVIKKIKKAINLNKDGNPVGVADKILATEAKNGEAFALAAKEAFPEKDWPLVQRSVLDRLRERYTDFNTKALDGEGLAKAFSDITDFGAADTRIGVGTLDVVFGKEMRQDLQRLFKALHTAQKKNPTKVGGVGTSLVQGGAVAGAAVLAAHGEFMGASQTLALVAGIPWLFAKIGTSRKMVKLFTKGLLMEPNNPAWGSAYREIMRFISVANTQREREARGPVPQPTTRRTDPLAQQLLSGPQIVQ